MYDKICRICSKEFKANYPNEWGCSNECKKELAKLKSKRYREKILNSKKQDAPEI